MVLALFLRPKDAGAGLKISHLQLFMLAGGGLATAAAGYMRQGKALFGWAIISVIPFIILIYWLALMLRRKAAQLPPAELSDFLCYRVLLGGVSAMAPMFFFIFEAVSCMTSNDGLTDVMCENTAWAAMFLNIYLVIITGVSIVSRTIPQKQGEEDGTTFSNLAVLRLFVREKVQGALGVVTAMVSMYLFSLLGVEGQPNETIFWVGVGGALALGIAAMIELISLASRASRGLVGDAAEGEGASTSTLRKGDGRLSVGRVGDDMIIATMV